MDIDTIAGLYKEHSKAHKVLDWTEAKTAAKLCEIAKAFLWSKARALVEGAGNRPVLLTYVSDSTPIRTTCAHTAGLQKMRKKKKKRAPGSRLLGGEGLPQDHYLCRHPLLCTLFRDPVGLTKGKDSWCQFTVACNFFPKSPGPHRHLHPARQLRPIDAECLGQEDAAAAGSLLCDSWRPR